MRLTHANQKTYLLILYPRKGIAQIHMICLNGKTTHLRLNSKHEKSGNKPQISLGNASAESVVAEVATLTEDKSLTIVSMLKLLQ